MRKRGFVQAIFCHKKYNSLQTQNSKFEIISAKNEAEIVKVPNIG